MATEHVSIIIKAKDLSAAAFKKVQAGLKSIGNVARMAARAFAAMTAAGAAVVVTLAKLAERGGKYVGVQTAFNKAVGGDGVKALQRLKAETKGLIGNYDLMAGFNRALALGSAETTQQFGELANVAIKLGRALGVDATFALESLNLGIGRQSRLILDNLGIIVSVEQANKDYAKALGKTVKELSEAEKKEAFRSAAMRAAEVSIKRLGGAQETAGESVKRLTNKFGDVRDRLAEIIAQSPQVVTFFNTLTDLLDQLAPKLETLTTKFAGFTTWLGEFFRIAGGALGLIDTVFDRTRESLAGLTGNVELLTKRKTELEAQIEKVNRQWEIERIILDVIQRSIGVVNSKWSTQATLVSELAAELKDLESEYRAVEEAAKAAGEATGGKAAPTPADTGPQFMFRPAGMPQGGLKGFDPERARAQVAVIDMIRRAIQNQKDYLKALGEEEDAKKRAVLQTQHMANTVIGAFAAMAAAAAAGSGSLLGSVIGGVAGIAMAIPGVGPIAAGAIAGGAGVLTALTNRRPTPVSIERYSPTALNQTRLVLGPRDLTFQFLNARGELTYEEIIHQTKRLEEIDAVVRIPGTRLGT